MHKLNSTLNAQIKFQPLQSFSVFKADLFKHVVSYFHTPGTLFSYFQKKISSVFTVLMDFLFQNNHGPSSY